MKKRVNAARAGDDGNRATCLQKLNVLHFHIARLQMGRDDMSVVDGSLRVYGVDGLRIADGSIMPRVTTGNTQAPCAIIGERAAEAILFTHGA